MHVDMRFDLEDRAAPDLVAQQRACDDWLTTFNHVRPHEALQQRTPAEVYRVSTRRPTPRTMGGFPEGCRMVRVNGHGNIHCAFTASPASMLAVLARAPATAHPPPDEPRCDRGDHSTWLAGCSCRVA